MDLEITDPGPFDASVLYDQDNHVSSAVWDGQERGVLRCHEHTSKLGEWRLTPKQIALVEKAGFGYLRQLPSISLDNPLISALVERWRKETNTFHLTVGEMTITLRDVALLLGLPIDGEPVLGVTYTSCKSVCERYLGRVPEAGYMSGGMVKLSWLKEYFSQCSDDSSLDDIECHTRAYLLYLVGSTIFSTTTGNKVPVMYLPLFEDFEKAGKYAWGAAALAFLYRSLGNASLKSQSTISGCLTLLQCWSYFHLNIGRPKFFQEPLRDCFPLVFWWKGKQSAATVKRDIVFYRKALDSLDPCDVDWLPFKNINSALIPESIKNSLILGRSKTMLICFDKAERHLPDRCLRQHGMRQGVPIDVQQWERKSRGIDSGIHLLAKMESELNEWSARRLSIVEEDGDTEESEYIYWYSRITRRLVGRPVSPLSQTQRTVKFRTKKKRMNTGLRDIAHIADTFSTKGLDPLQAESISRIRAIAHACLGDEVETTIMISDTPQIELGKRREKQRVRRNTNGKRKRKDDLVLYNTAEEEDEVLLYGSTAGVDQMHLSDAIIGVDHPREMIDHSYTKLGKSVRRRERAKKKIGRKRRRKDNLLKCDAAIRDLESLIAKEDLGYSHSQNKENQSHLVGDDLSVQLHNANVEVDYLQPYHDVVEVAKIESAHTSNEGEIAELSHDAVEGHNVDNFHVAGEVDGAEFSHAANEVERNEFSHDIMEVERAADEVEKSVPSHTADEIELAEFSHAADEVERNESSHAAAGVGERNESSHSCGAVERSEFPHAANEVERNESSHGAAGVRERNKSSNAHGAVERAESSLTGGEVETPEPSHDIMEVEKAESSHDIMKVERDEPSHAAAEIEKVEPSHAACDTENAEPSHAAGELEKAEPSHAAEEIEKVEPSHAAQKIDEAKPSHAAGEIEKAEPSRSEGEGNKPSHAVQKIDEAEPYHAAGESEKAEPSRAAGENENNEPSCAAEGEGNKPSHAACETERDESSHVAEIGKDASSRDHDEKSESFDASGENKKTGSSDAGGEKSKSSDEGEKVGYLCGACRDKKKVSSPEASEGNKTAAGSSHEAGEGNKSASCLASVKVDDTKLSVDHHKVGDLNQSVVADEIVIETENVGVEANPGPSPETAKDAA